MPATTTARARLFQNGHSQAVRLPKAFRFPGREVRIRREGRRVVLEPVPEGWSDRFRALFGALPDFPKPSDRRPEARRRAFP